MTLDSSLLTNNELFRGLSQAEAEKIANLGTTVAAPRNTNLSTEGQESRYLYIVLKGRVLLRKHMTVPDQGLQRETPVTECTRGQIVGWSALVEPYTYTLTATTVEDSQVLRLEGRAVLDLLDKEPELGYKVMTALARVVSRRLRQIEEAMVGERALVIDEARTRRSNG